MNAIIFRDYKTSLYLPFSDPKAVHIKEILKAQSGDEIFAGILNQALFKVKVFQSDGGYEFSEKRIMLPNPEGLDVHLLVSFARPQIAKRILFEAACFGVKKLGFYTAAKGEAGYAQSSLYSANEYEEQLIRGAEQACACNIPEFNAHNSLTDALRNINAGSIKLAPDLYEATAPISQKIQKNAPITLVFGGERGFSNPDRELLRQNNFTLVSLGNRPLRTDTAAIGALSIIKNI